MSLTDGELDGWHRGCAGYHLISSRVWPGGGILLGRVRWVGNQRFGLEFLVRGQRDGLGVYLNGVASGVMQVGPCGSPGGRIVVIKKHELKFEKDLRIYQHPLPPPPHVYLRLSRPPPFHSTNQHGIELVVKTLADKAITLEIEFSDATERQV